MVRNVYGKSYTRINQELGTASLKEADRVLFFSRLDQPLDALSGVLGCGGSRGHVIRIQKVRISSRGPD